MQKKTILFSIIPILVLGLWLQAPKLTHAQENTGVNEERVRERQAEERRRAEDAANPGDEKAQIPANEPDVEPEADMAGGCILQNGASPASLLQGLAFLMMVALPLVPHRKKVR